MQRSSLLLEIDFNDLLCVVPGAAGISHEDRLVQTKDRNRDQISNEVERLNESEGQSGKKDGEKNVEHAFLRVLGTNLHALLAVSNRCLLHALEPDVRLDELDRTVGSGGQGLCGSASEPVNHRASADQTQHKWRVQKREFVNVLCKPVRQRHDD